MAFTVVTVTGTYTNADGDPAKGSVTFYPSALLANSSGDRMAPTARVKVELDDTGSLSIPLFATDDADTLPIGGTYTIVERISGADERIWRTAIPNASGTIDLADLAPVNTPPYISYSPVGHSHSEFDWIDGWLPTWLLWPDEMRAIQTALSNVENQKVRVAIVGCDAVSGAGATNRLAGLAGQTAQRLEVAFNNANGGDGYYGLEDMGPTGFSSADTGIDGKGMSATSAASVNQVSAASHGAVIFHDASQTGTWRYQVDAGGWTSVVSTGVGVPGTPVAVDYGSTGSFDLQIEWVSGTVSIDGVHFTGLDPTPNSGLEVLAAGVANETLADIDSTTRIDSYGGNGVDLVIVMTGYRDLTDAVAQDAWGTNITDVITKLRAENTNMSVLVVPYWEFASTSETVWESWRQEAKTRAAANSAAFLDLYNLIGSTDTDPYSYTSDGDELVDLGHSYIGLGLAQFVTAAPTSVTIAGTIPPVDTANFVKKNDDNTYDADKVQTHQATADTTDVVTVTGPGATANLSARALEVVEGAASVNITPTGFVATGSSGTVVFAVAATDKMTILDGTLSATEIVHADASASNESATLSQVDDAIDTAEATLDGRIAEPDTSDESSPVDGLVQVRTDLEQIQQYDGSTWHLLARKFVGAKIRRTTGISKAEGWNATNHTVTDWEEGIVRITTEGSGNTGQGVHIPTDYGGKFELSVRSEWAANNVGWRGIRIAVAPSDVGGTDYDLALVPSSGSTFQHRHSASVELELADDDFVYPEHYQNSGGVLTLGSVWFSIRRIGD